MMEEEGLDGSTMVPPPPSTSPFDGESPLECIVAPCPVQPMVASKVDPALCLTDDLREKVVRQVEYYFSDENLPTDKFLLSLIKRNKKGFVPIHVIASFRKMKKLVQDNSLIEAALRTSSQLVVSLDGKQVRRLSPFQSPMQDPDEKKKKEAKLRTVLVKNLPEDHTVEDIRRIFGSIGNIKGISFQDFKGSNTKKENGSIGNKMHIFIEYETVEAANDAVTKLNDQSNWRNGIHVELLLKKKEKHVLTSTGRKCTSSENHNNMRASNSAKHEKDNESTDPLDKMAQLEEGGRAGTGKEDINGEMVDSKDSLRGRQQLHVSERGRWRMKSSFTGESVKVPPPAAVPRTPDGTRGFTMGRGKPISQLLL